MNGTIVKRKSYGDQPGRGAREATISQGRIKKGFAKTVEQVPIYDQTSLRKMVMDAAPRDP
jgi:hypothetical protein